MQTQARPDVAELFRVAPTNDANQVPRFWVPNLDFEHRLGPKPMSSRSRKLAELNADLAATLLLASGDCDSILLPQPISEDFFAFQQSVGLGRVRPVTEIDQIGHNLRITPWGWDRWVERQFPRLLAGVSHPQLSAVEVANSRRFSFKLECELGCQLDGSGMAEDIDELARLIGGVGSNDEPWVVKADFGMSGRERFLGNGPEITDALRNWARRRLGEGQAVFVEPWVQIEREFGLQFDVSHDGTVRFIDAVEQETTPSGQYCGSTARCCPAGVSDAEREPDVVQAAFETCQTAAERIAGLGYFGPLGIDVAVYRDSAGAERIRPLQDINARFTMGRLCLGLLKLAHPGERVRWQHGRYPGLGTSPTMESIQSALKREHPEARLVIPTSPCIVGGRPVRHATWAVFEPDSPES